MNSTKQKGQIVVDFYENKFSDKYSDLKDSKINEINSLLNYYSKLANEAIINEEHFTLSILFSDKGSKIGNPNRLEKFIEKIE